MDDISANVSSSGFTVGVNLTALVVKLSLSRADEEQLFPKFPDAKFAELVILLGKLPAAYYPDVKAKLLDSGLEAALTYVKEILREIKQKLSVGRTEGGR